MSLETSYTEARANLAALCEKVANEREVVIIRRRGHEDVALISADELSGIAETAHLLRSPANRRRLLGALKRAKSGRGRKQTAADLRREVGLGKAR